MTFDRDALAGVVRQAFRENEWVVPPSVGFAAADAVIAHLNLQATTAPVEGDRDALIEVIAEYQACGSCAGAPEYAQWCGDCQAEADAILAAGFSRSPLPVEGEVERRCGFSLDQGCLCDLPKGHAGLHECASHRFSDRPLFGEVAP